MTEKMEIYKCTMHPEDEVAYKFNGGEWKTAKRDNKIAMAITYQHSMGNAMGAVCPPCQIRIDANNRWLDRL